MFLDDLGQVRALSVVFAAWAAIVICVLLFCLYRYLSPRALDATSVSVRQFTRVTQAAGAATVDTLDTLHTADCPAIMASLPSKSLQLSKVVCFDIGQHADVSSSLTFRPRYVKVNNGYSLIAFGDKYFGEPVQYRYQGPTEVVFNDDALSKEVLSLVIYMNISRPPVIRPCRLSMRMSDGQEACLADGTHVSLLQDNERPPKSAIVHKGYRAKIFGDEDLVGTPILDMVGPVEFVSTNALGQTVDTKGPWKSANVLPCGVTAYSAPSFKGDRVCQPTPIPQLAFQPKSMVVAEGCTVRAFEKDNFTGRMVWTGEGGQYERIPDASQKLPWKSLDVRCPQLGGYARASQVSKGARRADGRTEPCISFRKSSTSGSSTSGSSKESAKVACLKPGRYDECMSVIGFEPDTIIVPQGLMLQVKNRVGEKVYIAFGYRVVSDFNTKDWYTALVLTMQPLPWSS
jgi:hypothetical protein